LKISGQVNVALAAADHNILAGNVEVVAEGVFIDSTTDDLLGILVTSTDTFIIGDTARSIDFTAQDTFNVLAVGAGAVATTNTHIESTSDLSFVAQTITAPVADFTARSEGLTIAPQGGSGIDIDVTNNVDFIAGLWEDEAQIFFTTTAFTPTTGITFLGANIELSAESNIQMKSRNIFDATFSDDITIFSLKGDILFRSITLDSDGAQDGPFDLTVRSLNAEPGITFNTFYRFAHRQHLRLSMFDPINHAFRPPAPDADSAQQQPTTVFNWAVAGHDYLNACECSFGLCGNVVCPETTARVAQLQQAMIDLGLLYRVN
jgi:hypothetical protein